MSKWVNVSEVNNTLGKALEACKDELTPSFYSGAKCVLDKINEIAEQTEPQTHTVDLGNGFSITANDCDTCNHKGCENCVGDNSNPYCVPSNYHTQTNIETMSCDECKHFKGWGCLIVPCHYEPKDEPQTDCAWK